MSQKKPLVLDTAARKFFASQLLSCSVRQGRGIIHQELYNSEPINQVWVQGTVVLLSANGNDLLLDDGTGIIQATGVTEIVKDLFIHKGILQDCCTSNFSHSREGCFLTIICGGCFVFASIIVNNLLLLKQK